MQVVPKSVAVIGVGSIGNPIAHRILSAGFQLTVCDRSEEALSHFNGLPLRVTRQPIDCAGSDVILILVATPKQARDVIAGDNGICKGLQPSSSPVIVIMSTVGPDAMVQLRDDPEMAGLRLIDAPVSGGVLRAEQGQLTVLVGGMQPDVDYVKPVFQCLADRLFYCGQLGAAQTVKVVNNVLATANVLVSAEAYRLARARGIVIREVTPAIDAGSGRNHLSEHPGVLEASYSRWASTRDDFDSIVSILCKDLHLAQQLASESNTPMPFVSTLAAFFETRPDEIYESWKAVGATATNDH